MNVVTARKRERGAGLFIVIILVAGLAALGVSLLTLTSMGPKMSGGLRSQEEAFNAAEAGFNTVHSLIKGYFSGGTWLNFDGHYLTQPSNIALPFISGAVNPSYFRRMTDEEILLALDPEKDGTANYAPLLAFQQTFATNESGATDTRLAYTAFLINDEAAGGAADPNDVLLVVIGVVRSGTRILASTRLEIVLQYVAGG
ncbi:MAG: PilX N-terminal domain-containing pilus assembly protein [Candidatus Aminicenantes bacterium]|nr:PilX N-terminal domain-containing pilus assembly protein [Candidatus Aminicenantes bacterium]